VTFLVNKRPCFALCTEQWMSVRQTWDDAT